MPQISLKVNENGTLTIKDQNTSNPPLAEDGLLKLYAPLASPALTGNPTAPTPTDINDASTKIATTSFVGSKIAQVNNTINSVSGASVTLTGAQEITGSKTFTNNYTKIQDVSGNVKLEVKNTGVEIRGQIEMYGSIKPVNLGAGVVHNGGDGILTAGSIVSEDIASDAVTNSKIDAGAVTLAKINPSVYSVSNTPNTLVQRDSSGNILNAVTLTDNQIITGSKTFVNNSIILQDVSGVNKLEIKNTGVEISGIIKPINIGPVGFVYKDITTGNLITKSIISGDEIDTETITDSNIADFSILSNKIATNAVTLAKINPSVYSVSNTPNTLVQRDSSGNIPANNNWIGNNAFSSNQFFIGGTVDAPMYKPFGLSILSSSPAQTSQLQLAGTNLSRYYICARTLGDPWDIYLPKMTSDMLGIVITFRNVTNVIPTINAWLGDSPDQILDNSNNVITPTLGPLENPPITTVTIIAGYIAGQIGMWFII